MFRLPWSIRRARGGWCAFVLCCLVILTASECGTPTTISRPSDGENDIEVDPFSDSDIGPPDSPDGDGAETDPVLLGDDDLLDPELPDGESSQVLISGCEFTVFRLDGSLAPQPIQVSGPFNLTVRADVYTEDAPSPTAKLLGGDSLDGVLFIWNINGALTSGFLDTHAARSFQVSAPGVYTISLSLESEGDDIQCLSSSSGAPTYELFVLPMLSGAVTDKSGDGITGASVLASGEGFTETDVTEDDGGWDLFVPFEWSGRISASHEDYTFDPENVSLEIVTEDTIRDFVGTSNATPPPAGGGVGCSPPDCDDNNECTADACNGSTCSNAPVADGTACDDGDTCLVGETCQSGSCTVGAAQDCSGLNTVCGTWSCDPNRSEGNCDTVAPLNENGVCDDGRFCTVTDACSGGICVGTGDNCPGQACDEAEDKCVNPAEIAGTVTFPATQGSMIPDGLVTVIYSQDGTSNTFTATIDSNGEYSLIVPDNSSGAVAVDGGDLDHCILIAPNSRVYVNVTGTNNGEDFVAWCPPIGIPTPDFGIADTHHMYTGRQFDFGSGLVPYPDDGDGPYTHYVDNSVACSNSGNEFGSPSLPRCGIPLDLTAGSVVEVHGGPYDANTGDKIRVSSLGTAASPVFVRGATGGTPTLQDKVILQGEYMVFENFYVFETKLDLRIQNTDFTDKLDHIVIRSCEFEGDNVKGGLGGIGIADSGPNGATPLVTNIVVYDCHIHRGGDAEFFGDPGTGTSGEDDVHGINVTYPAQNIWILDNHIHDMGGDAVQVGHNADFTTHHVYVGRNHMHDDGENAVDIKEADDVIVSQNVMHGYEEDFGSSPGEGFVVHLTPSRVWVLYNEIFDANIGLISTACDPFFAVGNVVHDILSSGIDFRGLGTIHVVGNTITRAGYGINGDNGPTVAHLVNNIITDITDPTTGFHISYDGGLADLSDMHHNLLFQTVGSVQIEWNGTFTSVVDFNAAETPKGDDSLEVDPLFVDAPNDDFRLQAGSPAIDAGTGILPDTNLPNPGDGNDVYDLFELFYGISIRFDPGRNAVPTGDDYDIGAHEQ